MGYDHREEAHMRLAGSVIMYGDRPFQVVNVDGASNDTITLTGYLEPGHSVQTYRLNDPLLTWHKIRLGYCNRTDREALYLIRTPARRATQGLCNGNVRASPRDGGAGRGFEMPSLCRTQGFADMFAGRYPTCEQAINMLNDETTVVAFARQFALRRDEDTGLLFLCYRGQTIGFTETGHEVRLGPKYKYLRDVCIENNLRIR